MRTAGYDLLLRGGLLFLAAVLGSGAVPGADALAVPSDVPTVATTVERVSFTPRSDGEGLVVRFHTDARVQAYTEPRNGPGVLELTLFNSRLGDRFQKDEPAGIVDDLRLEQAGAHLVVRVGLEEGVRPEARVYRDRGSPDLLLSLRYAPDALALPTPARPVEELPAEPLDEGAAPSLPDASHTAGERWKLDVVVIDAGHGGHDSGARANGVREKDVVLPVARKLGHYLESRLGVEVVYTRTDDRFLTLRDRGRIANQAGGKLFISIHANAARNRSAYGAETFFLGMHKTETARAVMERENEVVKLEDDPGHYADFNEQTLILRQLAMSANLRKSEQLAELIQAQFTDRVGRRNRGVKQAGFLVLWAASMPAVLVELGFVTNPSEARFLRSEQGQDYLASAIFRAVRDYKEQLERELNLPAE